MSGRPLSDGSEICEKCGQTCRLHCAVGSLTHRPSRMFVATVPENSAPQGLGCVTPADSPVLSGKSFRLCLCVSVKGEPSPLAILELHLVFLHTCLDFSPLSSTSCCPGSHSLSTSVFTRHRCYQLWPTLPTNTIINMDSVLQCLKNSSNEKISWSF